MSSNHYEPVVSSWNILNNLFISCYFLCQDVWSMITGKSHLERILVQPRSHRAQIISHVEWFLVKTQCLVLGSLKKMDPEELLKKHAVSANGQERLDLIVRLDRYLTEVVTYNKLLEMVDEKRRETFNVRNSDHVEKLRELWCLTIPNKASEFALVSILWQDVGFQGNDPSTDLRGMGMLSIDQLIFLAKKHPKDMKNILQLCNHPTIGFPMAVAGITISSLTFHMLKTGILRKHFYNLSASHKVDFIEYNNAYCHIFKLFCEYWIRSNPKSVMCFNEHRLNFEKSLYNLLNNDRADLLAINLNNL